MSALVDEQGRVALRVTPGARGDAMTIHQGKLLVKVRARPHDGEANAAVLALVAAALGVPKTRLHLIRGAGGRDKLIQVEL